jgi:hypothetical protein
MMMLEQRTQSSKVMLEQRAQQIMMVEQRAQ